MNPEAKALLALPGFAWVPGMVGIDPAGVRWVVYHVDEAGTPMSVRLGDPRVPPAVSPIVVGTVPDLGHGGTAGILLGMLEAAAPGRIGVEMRPGEPPKVAVFQRDQRAKWGGPMSYIEGDSLGVAVARALVAIGRCA